MENHERVERELLECSRVATLVECFAWLQRCEECIERLEEFCQIDAAFESRISTGAMVNVDYIEPRRFLEDAREIVLECVRDAVERHGSAKVNTAFNGEFATKDKRANKSIISKNSEIYRYTDLREQHIIEPTLTSLEEFQERDSGWALSRILNLVVNVNKLNSMRAGCYFEVPREIATKRAVINVSTMDNACFAWSVVAALYPAERNVNRESSCLHYTTVLNLAGIEFPITFKDIPKFERLNAVSINVYGIENKQVLPLQLTSDRKDKHVNLLYMQDPRDDGIGHFAWIKNLSRLVSSQLSKKEHKKHFCDRTSLDKLASYLDKDKLKIIRSKFSTLSDDEFELLTRIGVFPYEYIDCAEKLQDTRLPPRESFYSSLTGDIVSESDYAHAANVWQRFSIRTLGEYSDLYLKTDVLLADIFENFRESCVGSYGLDPAHYYTLLGFTWDVIASLPKKGRGSIPSSDG
ncbi:hypothetical protein ALC56_04109 [Trachymyrmex septentrionalis]|uniref:DNA-directed DNA polymerase n=1 Tax=Trachymyrmex septentrionalis TaxID=34720 RepID=A0A151JYD5_9HYME|nr:hypothetical protein ALC56_04109 [Trachymyrmex septentrionalis]